MTPQASSSATTRKIYEILLGRSKAFHLKRNRFEILQHIKNTGDGVPSNPFPLRPLVPRWGMNLRVRPRVNRFLYVRSASVNEKNRNNNNNNPIPYLLQEIQRKLLKTTDTEQTIQQGQDVIFNKRYIGEGL